MVGRLLRASGSALVIVVAFVTPVLATASGTAASADTVIDGCTIVSNPTPTNFTNCPGANFGWCQSLRCRSFVREPQRVCSCAVRRQLLSHQPNERKPETSHSDWHQRRRCHRHLQKPIPRYSERYSDLQRRQPQRGQHDQFLYGGVDFSHANLTGANLTGSNMDLVFTSLLGNAAIGATLTGANLTGTILVPSNQSVGATSQAGAVATWPTPSGIPGATPGSCTPASGSTFPLFVTTVTCQVLDSANNVATGTFQVAVQPTTQYFTRIGIPSNGAVLAGVAHLDAAAGDGPGVTSVVFEVSGGTVSDQVVATASPSIYGWLASWTTTSVPNGTYALQSVTTDAAANTDTSEPITVTVNNQPPTTAVLIPSGGANLSGPKALLDASASSAVGIASVTYAVSGNGLTNQVVATGTRTLYGYLAQWNTTAVPNGTYDLSSVATDTVAEVTSSASVTVTVDNPPPTTAVLIPSTGTTQSGTTALLDASSSANVNTVTYELSGGPSNLSHQPIATGSLSYYGWLAEWNTTAVPNGTYSLVSVAAYPNGVSTTSAPVTINVNN